MGTVSTFYQDGGGIFSIPSWLKGVWEMGFRQVSEVEEIQEL